MMIRSTSTTFLTTVWMFFLLPLWTPVQGELWHLHNLFQDGDVPFYTNDHGHRFMLLETGNRADINQTANTCQTTASELICNVRSLVSAVDETSSNMDITVRCVLESQNAFDFRTAPACSCGVVLTDEQGRQKPNCGCVVCPDGFGNNPISIECQDEFVIGTCTSLDCDFACNGTCAFDCSNSGPECSLCQDNPFAPTVAPTGTGARQGRPTLISSSSPSHYFYSGVVAAVTTLLMTMSFLTMA